MTEITSAALTVMISLVVILISVMVMNSLLVILITVMISVAFSRTSSSSGRSQNSGASFPLNTIPDASSSPSSPSVPASSSRAWKYDVFLSFRGEDTRKTFVDHLYSVLVERVTCTYKDDVTLSRGDTIGPSLFTAIKESQIAIIIFSKNYADSSWCLNELEYIMKGRVDTQQIVIPIFYDVEPSEVRKQKGEFGKAFSELIKEKNITKAKTESWKKALVDASNIAGWELKHIAGGHEAKCIKDIVGTILDKLLYLNSVVDKDLVGMGTRLQDLKSQLNIGSSGVRMVGIWGIGGGGKTTLASSLYIEISTKFDSCCFLEKIKDESCMKTLQEKILSTVLKIQVKVGSVDNGKHLIKTRLGRKNVLLILDDIDDHNQLEALAGSHDWFGDGSRIIITTRDEHLLRIHRVDEVSHVCLLSDVEAIRLFNRLAYNEDKLVKDYEILSQRVVSYAVGLPLAIKVLGKFLYDKNTEEWISTLNRLNDIPEMEIVEKLKISYDGLKPLEKELFLDIACFFRGRGEKKKKDEAMPMLEACGFHPHIGVKVLIQKALITINSYYDDFGRHDIFDMHDLVQEMGLHIVRGEHPNNPEKHSRLWRPQEIEDLCSGCETTENVRTEAIICYDCPSNLHKLVSNAKKLRLLSVNTYEINDIEAPNFLSNELRYMFWERYPASTFPESFQPRKLVVLKLRSILQEELWRGFKYLPCLKELEISYARHLVRTPDFGGLPCLQKLKLYECSSLEEIHSSLGSHTSLVSVYIKYCEKLKEFPTIVKMRTLEILEISTCKALRTFPKIEANMDGLVNLSLSSVGIDALPLTIGKFCTNLRSLMLESCFAFKSIEDNLHALKHLHTFKIHGFGDYITFPKDLLYKNILLKELHLYNINKPSIPHLPCFLKRLCLSYCRLKDREIPCDIGELSDLQELDLSGNYFSRLNFSLLHLSQLKLLRVSGCRELVELPEIPTSMAILEADGCCSLEVVGDFHSNCKWLCQVSLWNVGPVIGGDRLLQSMFQGHAIENRCMSLRIMGVEIPKGFIPTLLRGRRYLLELPENWCNHFSGFLMCVAADKNYDRFFRISMKHEKGGTTGIDSQPVFWKESDGDKATWVWYVSFGSLIRTAWWDPTSTKLDFSFNLDCYEDYPPESCTGFGVCLVSKRCESRQIETTPSDSFELSDDYTCYFRILNDSKSHLKCQFSYDRYNR